jgi:hypothetical protein
MTAIDLSPVLKKIERHYPMWWRSEAALRCLRQLWAGAPCNDSGVFEDYETICVHLEGERLWHAELFVATAPNGWRAVGADYWYPLGGGGSKPSVWNETAFTTRDEAIAHGINGLIASFEGVRDSAFAPEGQGRNASRMLETLRGCQQTARQLSLF